MPQPDAASARHETGGWPLVAAATLALQGIVVLAFAAFYLLEFSRASSTFGVLGSVALFVVTGVGLLVVARGLLDARRWARSPALTWQIVCLPVAYGLFQGGLWYAGLPLGVSALVILRGLFAGQR